MNGEVALISLGANLGDRQRTLEAALVEIHRLPGVQPLKVSRFHETAPIGGPGGQPPYLNAAASFAVEVSAESFAKALHDVERRLGRTRAAQWDSRTLDLDLLLFGNFEVSTPELEIPHPRFALRSFVLEPLDEIASNVIDPLTNLSIGQLSENLRRRPARASLLKAEGAEGRSFEVLREALTEIGWEIVEPGQVVPTLFIAENHAERLLPVSERWQALMEASRADLPLKNPPAPVWWVDLDGVGIDLANLLATCRGIVGS